MDIKANLDKVIVIPIEETNEDKNGVYLGNADTERFKKGKVQSVGHLVKNIEPQQVIWYDKSRCTEINLNKSIYDIMFEKDVWVIET